MKYLLIFLAIILVAGLCGAGLAIGAWLTSGSSGELSPPPTVDPNLLPTPTIAAGSVDNQPANPTAQPSPNPAEAGTGQFNGTFSGTLFGSSGSSAPVTLEISQSNSDLTGVMNLGTGLVIDGGNCGSQAVPAGSQTAIGRTDPANPNHLDAAAVFEVQGLTITIGLAADISPDGNNLTTEAVIDLPMLCGPDPVLNGTFTRQ